MTISPLNPHLFGRLEAVFGRVTIADAGSHHSGVVTFDAELKAKWTVLSAGEYYRVACPFCSQVGGADSNAKQRLWINHAWGVTEPQTKSRRWFLAHCFNENCLSPDRAAKGFDNLRDLQRRIYTGLPNQLPIISAPPAGSSPPTEESPSLPEGGYLLLDQVGN